MASGTLSSPCPACHPLTAAHHGDDDSTTGVSDGGGGDGGCSTVAKITGVSSPSALARLTALAAGSGSPGCSSLITTLEGTASAGGFLAGTTLASRGADGSTGPAPTTATEQLLLLLTPAMLAERRRFIIF